MSDPGVPFSASVGERAGELVVVLRGELDLASASAAEELLVELSGSTIIVDLGEVSFLDAAGLRALLQAKRRIEGVGHHLLARNARGIVARVLEVTGLSDELLES